MIIIIIIMAENVYDHSMAGTKHDQNEKLNEDEIFFNCNIGENRAKDQPNADIFILCDGHGGKNVSKYVVNKLYKKLYNKSFSYPLEDDFINEIYDNIQNEIEEVLDTDNGTTATVIIIYLNKSRRGKNCENKPKYCAQVIHLGDSRAVMSKNNIAMQLTLDHICTAPIEKTRLSALGKYEKIVKYIDKDDEWKINGCLVPSRSLGDRDQKPYVTHKPAIYHYEISQDVEFIIIGCDGIWDVFDNQTLINYVNDILTDNIMETWNCELPTKRKNIATQICEFSLKKGSADDLSVILILF